MSESQSASKSQPRTSVFVPSELRASSVLRDLACGGIVAVVAVASALSNAALVFSGELAFGFAYGVKAALLTAVVAGLAVTGASGFRFAIAGPDSNSSAVLAVMLSGLLASFPAGTDPGKILATLLLALALATLGAGAVLFTLGRAGFGTAIRYIPYPLIGGFLAATGWLMAVGAVRVMTGRPLTLAGAGTLLEPGVRERLLVGLAFAALLVAVLKLVRHFAALPAVLAGALVTTHVVFSVLGTPLEAARAAGWLFEAQADVPVFFPWQPGLLSDFQWSALAPGLGAFVGLIVITAISILLNASGLELATNTDVDLNRELRVQGVANLACAAGGGFVGYLSLGRSLLAERSGASSRLTGAVVAVACGFILFGGVGMVAYVPRFLLGGLLLYMGVSLLWEWAVASWRRLSPADYAMVLTMLLVTAYWGFINAVITGLIAGCIVFAINYSRTRFIKHDLDGREFRSNVERSQEEHGWLSEHGDRTRILVLQGYLFFGAANGLYQKIRSQLAHDLGPAARFLILDFRFVHGVDSSAALSFLKIATAAEQAGARIVVTGVSDKVEKGLADVGFLRPGPDRPLAFPDLDRATEWCESELLRERELEEGAGPEFLVWLGQAFEGEEQAAPLVEALTRRELAPGEALCRQGDPSSSMYLVERGRVSIMLALPDQPAIRLRSMTGRTIVGEVGFFLGQSRSASVVAEEASVVHELSRERYERLRLERPEIADRLQAMVLRVLAHRLVFANGLIGALQR